MTLKHRIKFALAKMRGKVASSSREIIKPMKSVSKRKSIIKFDENMGFGTYIKRRKVYLEELVNKEKDEEKRNKIDWEYQLLEQAEELIDDG